MRGTVKGISGISDLESPVCASYAAPGIGTTNLPSGWGEAYDVLAAQVLKALVLYRMRVLGEECTEAGSSNAFWECGPSRTQWQILHTDRTYQDVGTSKNSRVGNCLTELFSANSKLAGSRWRFSPADA
jgi:hypothetical protein